MAINPIKPLRLKTKNYQQVAVVEIFLIFFVLIMGDLGELFPNDTNDIIVTLLFLVLEAFYLILLLQLTKFLESSKMINVILKGGVAVIFLLSFIALNPFFNIVEDRVPWLIAVHIILCSLECYVIAIGLKDIYSEDLHITERLWGSVAIYLLIALGWASFYEVFALFDSNSFGVIFEPGFTTYAESLYFSLCNLSGTSSAFTNPTHLIRNLALIESVWGALFLVMLIGRLFALPAKTDS